MHAIVPRSLALVDRMAPPRALIVEGAGMPACNGVYMLRSKSYKGFPCWTKGGDGVTHGMRIVRDRGPYGEDDRFMIGNRSLYYDVAVAVTYTAEEPPMHGWVAMTLGQPCPTVALANQDDTQDVLTFMRSLLVDEELADVVFKLDDGTTVAAHRAVLAARSPVFRKMLYGDMREAGDRAVSLSGGLQQPVLKAICEWAHTGNIYSFLYDLQAQNEQPAAEEDPEADVKDRPVEPGGTSGAAAAGTRAM